jgi:hypothetical protein
LKLVLLTGKKYREKSWMNQMKINFFFWAYPFIRCNL